MAPTTPNKTISNATRLQDLLAALVNLGINMDAIPGGSVTSSAGVESATASESEADEVATEPAESDFDVVSNDGATEDAGNGSDYDNQIPVAAADGAGGSVLVADPNSEGSQGIICTRCRTFIPVRAAGEPAYVVTVGLQVGVFTEWPIVQRLVSGVRGACFRKYGSNAAAQAAFADALNAGVVMVVAPPAVAQPVQGSSRGAR